MSIADLERRLDKVADPSVGALVTRYGTNVEKLKQDAAQGKVDPTKALMAKMTIDRIVAANVQPPSQGSVYQENMTPQPAGLAAVPTDPRMFQGMADGGIVAMAGGGGVKRFQGQGGSFVRGYPMFEEMTEQERMLYEQTGELPARLQRPLGTGLDAAAKSTGIKGPSVDDIASRATSLYGQIYTEPLAQRPGSRESYLPETEEFYKKAGVDLNLAAKQMKELAAERESMKGDRKEAANMRLLEAGLAILGGTSPHAFENIGKGAAKGLAGFQDDIKGIKKAERDLLSAERQLANVQNQVRMGIASTADQKYQKAFDKYESALEKKQDRMGDLARTIMQDDRARQVVAAQMRPTQYEQLRADALSKDPERRALARDYLGVSKTGQLNPALLEKEWGDMKIQDKLKLKKMGIETAEQYINYRLNQSSTGGSGAVQSGGNPTFSWDQLPK